MRPLTAECLSAALKLMARWTGNDEIKSAVYAAMHQLGKEAQENDLSDAERELLNKAALYLDGEPSPGLDEIKAAALLRKLAKP